MSDQLALIPETPPTLTPITTFIYDFRIGPHPPLDSSFVESVRRFGVLQPPVVRLREGVGYDVVDGRRRAAALKLLIDDKSIPFNTQVPAMLLSGNCSPEVLALMLNEQRSNNPVSDLAAIEALTAKGADIKEICAATGLGKGTVEKRMRLKNLILSFRSLFNEGKLPVSIAERLAKLPAEIQGDLFIHYTEVGRLTHGDIGEVRYAQQQAALATLPSTLFDGTPEDATGEMVAAHMGETPQKHGDRIRFPDEQTARKEAYYYLLFIFDAKGNAAYAKVLQQLHDEILSADPSWQGGDYTREEDGFYLWAQKQLATILMAAPPDAPKSANDALGFAAQVFADIGEAQAPGFLTADERVDISDVVITNPEPYDEDYTEEHIDAA